MSAGFIGQALLYLIGFAILLPRLPRTWGASAFMAFGVLHAAGFVLVAWVSGSEANAVSGLGIWHGVGAVAAITCGGLMSPSCLDGGCPVATPAVGGSVTRRTGLPQRGAPAIPLLVP